MKLRNKKTGEIVDLIEIVRLDDVSNEFYLRLSDNEGRTFKVGFNSLAELNEKWEDYEEPKEYWYVSAYGNLAKTDVMTDLHRGAEEIGNLFDTQEEAEKALEKLKAWKRLKDSGISFEAKVIDGRWYLGPKVEPKQRTFDEYSNTDDKLKEYNDDLMLVFGGEE